MRAKSKWAKSKWANAIRPYIALLIFLLLWEGEVSAQVVTENKVFPVGEVFELEAYQRTSIVGL